MPNELRVTRYGLRVLSLFMRNKGKTLAGSDIARMTNLTNGTLYPLLLRFEDAGLLISHWEKDDPTKLKRPRKRLYKITEAGLKRLLFEQSRD